MTNSRLTMKFIEENISKGSPGAIQEGGRFKYSYPPKPPQTNMFMGSLYTPKNDNVKLMESQRLIMVVVSSTIVSLLYDG